MKQKDSFILLFDGECNMCNFLVIFVIKRDLNNSFMFASLQSEKAINLLKINDLPTKDVKTLVFIDGDHHYTKSTAVLKILRELSGYWPILYILIFVPKFFRDLIYSFIAKNRYYFFGKQKECIVPNENIRQRFL